MKRRSTSLPPADGGLVSSNLVTTKFAPLTPDPRAIVRTALAGCIDDVLSPVTVIVAPAGSGKSTLMAQLYSAFTARGLSSCWLSLDAEDNDPATFALYFISALNSVEPGFARDELIALEANPLRNFEQLFDRLVGRLSAITVPHALFLDDLQYVSDENILRFLDRMLAHLPKSSHVVLASRVSLPLKLARLRVAGSVVEIHQEGLNFDRAQAGQFLKNYHDLELAPRDLQALIDSTEGWPTGVQLAALALRRHKGPAAELIKTFSGRDRDLTRYLVESVLRMQPDSVRKFLLRTSPLRRMCADLCLAATGEADAADLLEYIGHANLFLIPLDREGVWFRYHHLFADFLQGEFRRSEPAAYRRVCNQAAKWCELNDLPAEAIRYLLEAEHYDEAAGMIARHAPHASMYRGDHYTVLNWLRRLPARFHDRHPEILLAHAWSCAFSREPAKAMEISQQALNLLEAGHWKLEPAEHERYALLTRNVQAATQACADAIEDCLVRATELRRKVTDAQPFIIATLSNCLGYSHFVKREFVQCRAAAVDAHEYGHRADAAYLSAWGDFLHGLTDVEMGQLKEAEMFCRGVHKDSQGLGLGQRSYVAGLSALLEAEIAVQRCDFARAGRSIEIGRAFKDIFGPVEPQLVALRNEARLLAHGGRLDEARIVLQEGQDAALREQHSRLHLALAVEEASLQLGASDLAGASETARKWRLRGLSAAGSMRAGLFKAQRDALRFLEARFCLAEEKYGTALRTLTALQQDRDSEPRGGFHLAVTVHRAVALWGQGKPREAARQLDAAMEMAAAEFHVWPLVSAGRPLLEVLDSIRERRPDPGESSPDLRARLHLQEWLSRWLRGDHDAARPGEDAVRPERESSSPPVDALTRREIKLLRLLQSGMDNRRLAEALLLSESTIKWHLHNVYSKLGVRSRGEAVARAMQCGLI